jgi:hypothetical protein
MGTGLQQAEEQIQSMLSDTPVDKQQQMESDTGEEVQEEVEIEAESEAIEPELTESEETEEVTEQESSEDKYYPIKLDGEDMEITLDEALQGYQRQSDYTKKTQVLANERKQVEAEKEALSRQREQYKQNVDRLIQEQQSQQPDETDWDKLYEEDPLQWMKQKEDVRSKKEKMFELQQEQFRLQQAQEQQAQMQEYLTQQQKALVDTIPEWKDPEVMAKEKSEIRNYAKSIGYSDQELSQIYDSRAVFALRAGMKASGLSSKGKVKLRPAKEAIRAVTPGTAAQQPREHTTVSKAKMTLAKTGKMSDAEKIFKHLL